MLALILLVVGFVFFGIVSILSFVGAILTWNDYNNKALQFIIAFLVFGTLSTVCGIVGGVQAINTIIHEAKTPVAVQSHR